MAIERLRQCVYITSGLTSLINIWTPAMSDDITEAPS